MEALKNPETLKKYVVVDCLIPSISLFSSDSKSEAYNKMIEIMGDGDTFTKLIDRDTLKEVDL